MTPSILTRLALVVAIVGPARPAIAQMAIVPPPRIQSLDLPVMNAATVVTGVVAGFRSDSADGSRWVVTIAVKETLKGRHSERITEQLAVSGPLVEAWRQTSALLLIAIPSGTVAAATVINLSDKELAVMTADLVLLRSSEEVVLAAKEIVSRDSRARPLERFGVPIEAARVAGTALDTRRATDPATARGSTEFLFVDVPVDERLERLARDELRSADSVVRINGAQALRHFTAPGNIELLKPLLDDEGWEDAYSGHINDDNTLRHTQFNNVRREAFRTLQHLRVDVMEPASLRPENRDAQVISVALDARVVLPADISALARFRNLQDLYLSNQSLTNQQWIAIGQLQSLQALFLEGSNISDSTLGLLSGLADLVYLGLANTEVTDRGLLELAKFQSLRKVDLGPRITSGGVTALAKVRPDIRARLDEFAFLSRLSPRRVEQPFVTIRNWLLPVGDANPEARGLRCYALVFPKETAGQVDELLSRELPQRGWERVRWPGYRREAGVPIISRSGSRHVVDELFMNELGRDWPFFTPAPGERVIVVAWNVDPGN
jgi:hypothetical protein